MDRRAAKREACFIASMLIDGAIGVGVESIHTDSEGNERSEADARRIEAGLNELAQELFNRTA